SSGFELWRKFDEKTIEQELARGKKYFPRMNALRWWQSWDAFLRNPEGYGRAFETTLVLAEKFGLSVMPVLFNRWHDKVLDYGGIYLDHFLPGVSWVQQPGMFDAFLEMLVGKHAKDRRIFAWDLCNEPYSYSCPPEKIPEIVAAETAWLESLYRQCKQLGARAPITVGIHPGVPLKRVEPFSDVLSIHPYWVHNNHSASRQTYEKKLNEDVAFALKVGKPLIATECCWGDLNDHVRVESVRYSLSQLRKRNIGYLVYLLHHSLIADAHRPEFGPVGFPGNLAFIEADGSLRPGHEIFNEF
ncbi:MAG TPA: hypothetical protein PK644_04930, partial [bacterium]|nr:hypothetical protein [bacterium]